MKTVYIKAYPYAVQEGRIDIPDTISDDNNIQQYIEERFNNIEFNEPDLDYSGTDFDWELY